MALVLRIKFPPSYPVIYKTLRIDSTLTVKQAILFVNETLRVDVSGDVGLYLPHEKRWLDDDQPLNVYESLQDAEEVEFKDRKEKNAKPLKNNDEGCCVLI